MRHSKVVEGIMGEIPPMYVRIGETVIFLLFLILCGLAYWIQYPFITTVPVEIHSLDDKEFVGVIIIPDNNYADIKIGQSVSIKLDSFPYLYNGLLIGTISHIEADISNNRYLGFILFTRGLHSTIGEDISYHYGMKGKADIVIGRYRLITLLIPKNFIIQ